MSEKPNILGLLIGIDHYSQEPLEDGSYYPHLSGCVRDIEAVEALLKDRFRVKNENIIKLVSRRSTSDVENPTDQKPTYENLVATFKGIIDRAKKGDQVYIHYSGHGGRSRTMFPSLKGDSGLDESLVPCDIGKNGPCFLRDVEIAYLLDAMSKKGLIVSMVLDSCHSGGATRALVGTPVRGINNIYSGTVWSESRIAPRRDLEKAFSSGDETRNITALSGWRFPTPKNFVLVAACRANEVANEYAFDGKHRNGALTYWLLDGLRQMKGKCSFRMIHRHVLTRIHGQFRDQTPQLEGEGDRDFLGLNVLPSPPTILVTRADESGNITLNAGQLQGIEKGALFALFVAEETSFTPKNRRAIVEAINVDGVSSTVRQTSIDNDQPAAEGMQAILLGLPSSLRGKIFLAESTSSAVGQKSLERFKAAITTARDTDQNKWLEVVDSATDADIQLGVNGANEFVVTDAGGIELQDLRPPISIKSLDAIDAIT